MIFPQLFTERLVLRELNVSDCDALFRIFSDPDVTRFYNVPQFESLNDSLTLLEKRKRRYENGQGIHWGIVEKSDLDSLIGCCGYNAWNRRHRTGEIGYELERPYWNQGIMTEALQAMIAYGLQVRQLHQIEAWVMPDNLASIRVLTKLNFHALGVRADKGYWNGRFHDLLHFIYTRDQQKQR